MKRRAILAKAPILLLILIISLPTIAFALTSRPQQNEGENFIPNSFAESDAIRYGGLFGPLPEPDWTENWRIAEQNPELLNPVGGMGRSMGINSRDIGFGSDENHYIPINQVRSVD